MYHNVEHKNFTSPGAANLAQLTPCHMTPVAKEAAPSENSESRFVNGPGSVNKNLYYDLQIEIMSLNKHSLENCGDLLSRAKSPISVWTGSITLCANGSDFSWAGVVAKHRTGAKPGPRLLPKVKSQVSELVREEISTNWNPLLCLCETAFQIQSSRFWTRSWIEWIVFTQRFPLPGHHTSTSRSSSWQIQRALGSARAVFWLQTLVVSAFRSACHRIPIYLRLTPCRSPRDWMGPLPGVLLRFTLS